ncbi:MAG: ion transporter [Crocinitomicaceae bacterium]|nr:ion transporter [Crocinitomicaceae bacterium]
METKIKIERELRPWQRKMNEVIFGAETPAGKWFDIILLIIILISVIGVMLESVPGIREDWGELLHTGEWVLTIIFSLEYIARLLCVKRPILYIFSFYGVIDLLSVLPTYLGLFFVGTGPLRVLRCVRLLRLFRILKLHQFVEDSERLMRALKSSRTKITVFLFTVLMLVVILGTIMYLVEDHQSGFTSIPRSIYWAIVTLTTVGYGDIAPSTPLGQFIASIVMILGYAIIAVPTGIVTNELMNDKNNIVSNRACPNCSKDDHDEDADFCKHCGHQL